MSLICALLTGISGAGLFSAGAMGFKLQGHSGIIAQLDVMAFCVSTFCFLTATVTAAFFMQFARATDRDLPPIYKVLGYSAHMPNAYCVLCGLETHTPCTAGLTSELQLNCVRTIIHSPARLLHDGGWSLPILHAGDGGDQDAWLPTLLHGRHDLANVWRHG